MTATTRIRWEDAPSFDPADYLGYAGTADAVMFRIFNHEPLRNEWVLTTDLPGMQQARHFAEGSSAPAELKGAAEEWLNRFIASLGAVFPGPLKEDRLPLIGRDLVLVRNLAKQITDKGIRGHSYTPLSDYGMAGRGFAFEVLIHEDRKDTGRVAKVTVVLDRVEGTGS